LKNVLAQLNISINYYFLPFDGTDMWRGFNKVKKRVFTVPPFLYVTKKKSYKAEGIAKTVDHNIGNGG